MDRDLPSQSNNSSVRRRALNLSTRDGVEDVQSPTVASNENVVEITNEEKISIKLKFLNDEIKIDNHAHLNETVLSFKRCVHFNR
jgi:hypothetical protein